MKFVFPLLKYDPVSMTTCFGLGAIWARFEYTCVHRASVAMDVHLWTANTLESSCQLLTPRLSSYMVAKVFISIFLCSAALHMIF